MKCYICSLLVCLTLISSSSYGQLGFWKGYSISENLRDTYLRTLKIDKLNDDNTFSANTTISERDGSSLANFHAVGQVYFYETGYNISYVETFVSGILCDLSGCWKSPIGLFGDATISHEGVVIHGQWREVGLVGSVGAEFQLNLQPNISNIAQNQSLCGITHQCSFPEKISTLNKLQISTLTLLLLLKIFPSRLQQIHR